MTASEPRAPDERWITPDWQAPRAVRSLITTRAGGHSAGVYASLNLGDHVGDAPEAVAANRARVRAAVGAEPVWMQQVHGTRVIDAGSFRTSREDACAVAAPTADAAFARLPGAVCTVMTADCLPVLFCDDAASVVAVAHAGWRGLLAGVLEATIAATGVEGRQLMAYLGPAIGPTAFEVGDEVRSAFVAADARAASAFAANPQAPGKWFADLYLLARERLAGRGVERVCGGSLCTFADADRFFSYRRDGRTGRMAAMIWLDRS